MYLVLLVYVTSNFEDVISLRGEECKDREFTKGKCDFSCDLMRGKHVNLHLHIKKKMSPIRTQFPLGPAEHVK